jgi:hypothetical protein
VFPLPNLTARADILAIHTSKWAEVPTPELLQELASLCVGYCGADLKVRALLGYCWYCAALVGGALVLWGLWLVPLCCDVGICFCR